MEKKGEGNTFWIIIGAVMALAVLIILLLIFTGKIGSVGGGLMDCQSKGGFCTFCGGGDCEQVCQRECQMKGFKECSYSSVFSCPREKEGEACCLGVKEEGGWNVV